MPGMGGMAKKADEAGLNDKMLHHQIALINSMTKKERANPDLLAASRKKRIAAGSGLDVSDLNRLLKQHKQMADMMKKMGKGGMMKNMIKQFLGKGGMPDPSKMSPEQLAEAAKGMSQGMGGLGGMGGGLPPGMGGLPRGITLPAGLSGLMKKK
jgi:signal recognition particle subunit SRP54